MARRTKQTTVLTSSPVRSSTSTVTTNSPQHVTQQSHTITTIKESTRTTKHDGKGQSRTQTKTKTIYYVDGKPVKLNWFDKLRLALMGRYEKQAFLAEKLLEQERKEKRTVGTIKTTNNKRRKTNK